MFVSLFDFPLELEPVVAFTWPSLEDTMLQGKPV